MPPRFAMLGRSPSRLPVVAARRRPRGSHVVPNHRHVHLIPCQLIPFLLLAALLFGLALLTLAFSAHS